MRARFLVLFALAQLALAGCATGGPVQTGRQPSPRAPAGTARPLAWSADDSLRVATLRRDGRSVFGRHAIVWAPRDSISEDSLRSLLAGIEIGLAEVKRLIGAPLVWQRS